MPLRGGRCGVAAYDRCEPRYLCVLSGSVFALRGTVYEHEERASEVLAPGGTA